MKREQLIREVKEEYAKLADLEKQETFINESDETVISSDKYYEFVLDKVINMISYGAFDTFPTGKDVVQAVTNNKNLLLTKWNNDLERQIDNVENTTL